jgi:hypothetical protein
MSPSSDDATAKPEDAPAKPGDAAVGQPQIPEKADAAAPEKAPSDTADTSAVPESAKPVAPEEPVPAKGAAASEEREPLPKNVLLYTVFVLLCAGVGLWLVLAWMGYKEKYTQQTEGWRLGSTRMLEVTLIREDKKNLACASDKSFGDVHCGYHRNGTALGPKPEDDPHILQPFNTVKNELFLAAGLWQAKVLQGTALPKDRFTVVCNYHVVGVLKDVALRWSPTGSFNPVDQSVAAGTLSDCVIPQ